MHIVQVRPRDDLELAYVLLTIQHAAYALEAELIGDDRIPPLHENIDDLRSADLMWLVSFSGSRPIGAVGWSEDEEELDIDRLVVATELDDVEVIPELFVTRFRWTPIGPPTPR